MKLNRLIRQLHKFFGLIIGIQLMLWTVTGVYFNTMDNQVVSGNITKANSPELNVEAPTKTILNNILATTKNNSVINISFYALLNNNVVKIDTLSNSLFYLYTSQSYTKLTVDEQLATRIALQSYKSPTNSVIEIISVDKLLGANSDLPQNQQALYKVNFSDRWHTRVYVDALSGQVLRHYNNDTWLRDMAFMLHFMDYQRLGNFNHWLIITAAILSVSLVVSGMFWLVFLWRKGYYRRSVIVP